MLLMLYSAITLAIGIAFFIGGTFLWTKKQPLWTAVCFALGVILVLAVSRALFEAAPINLQQSFGWAWYGNVLYVISLADFAIFFIVALLVAIDAIFAFSHGIRSAASEATETQIAEGILGIILALVFASLGIWRTYERFSDEATVNPLFVKARNIAETQPFLRVAELNPFILVQDAKDLGTDEIDHWINATKDEAKKFGHDDLVITELKELQYVAEDGQIINAIDVRFTGFLGTPEERDASGTVTVEKVSHRDLPDNALRIPTNMRTKDQSDAAFNAMLSVYTNSAEVVHDPTAAVVPVIPNGTPGSPIRFARPDGLRPVSSQ